MITSCAICGAPIGLEASAPYGVGQTCHARCRLKGVTVKGPRVPQVPKPLLPKPRQPGKMKKLKPRE